MLKIYTNKDYNIRFNYLIFDTLLFYILRESYDLIYVSDMVVQKLTLIKLRKSNIKLIQHRLKSRFYFRFMFEFWILNSLHLVIFRALHLRFLFFWDYLFLIRWFNHNMFIARFFSYYFYNKNLLYFFDSDKLYFNRVQFNYINFEEYNKFFFMDNYQLLYISNLNFFDFLLL